MEANLKQQIAEEMIRIATDGFLMTGAFAGMEVSGSLFDPGYVYCSQLISTQTEAVISEYRDAVIGYKRAALYFRLRETEVTDESLVNLCHELWVRSLNLGMQLYALVPERELDARMDFDILPVVERSVELYCAECFDSVTGRGKGRVFLKKKIGRRNVVFDLDFGRYRGQWGMTVDIPQIGLAVDYGKFAGLGHTFESANPDALDQELRYILRHIKVFLSELQDVLTRFGLAHSGRR